MAWGVRLEALFKRIAVPLGKPGTPGAWLRSWRLMAIDGIHIDMPDSPANLKGVGKPEGGTRRPFPQIRAVGLGECGKKGSSRGAAARAGPTTCGTARRA